jgi:hypothetical protein
VYSIYLKSKKALFLSNGNTIIQRHEHASCVGMSSMGQGFEEIVSGCIKHQSSITKAGLSSVWKILDNGQF